eukprot:TRINITY_DN2223_c0_g1_i6.p1 TRINITY_DN2223_c0_g1~~TRINITY_DN2223_c0_g1_i6.p1  ORF type:complete len:299 (+),score=22.94 TRINITY_DN2223_c0_g1_i6:43-939(+)
MLNALKNMVFQATTKILFNKSVSDTSIPIKRGSRQGDPISGYLFNISLDVLNHMILQSFPESVMSVYGHTIPSLMYCDDTVICVNNPAALSKALNVLNEFAAISGLKVNLSKSSIIDKSGVTISLPVPRVQTVQYLGFKFNPDGIIQQSLSFLNNLPDKYWEVQKLNLSLIGMSQFTNSYILSKAIFWSTYEAITDKEWLEADRNVHLFRFGKGKKKNNNNNKRRYPSMSAIKSSFPYDDGGFEMWIPSIRSHASTASLFFHLLNESPILRSIIVNIVNKLDLVPSISNNSLMWSDKW